MRLIIDVGNTNIKLALFNENNIIKLFLAPKISQKLVREIMSDYPGIKTVFSCSTNQENKIEKKLFANYPVRFFELNSINNTPFSSSYQGKLGEDRLALSVGGMFFYGQNVLIIDLGTCITYDLVIDGMHQGGQISPGLQTRLNSLYHSTKSLPKIELLNQDYFLNSTQFIGKSTKDCILLGVFRGTFNELKLAIKDYEEQVADLMEFKYNNAEKNKYDYKKVPKDKLVVVVTGGDLKYFKNHIQNNQKEKIKYKNVIFDDNLLMKGLNCILNENIKN